MDPALCDDASRELVAFHRRVAPLVDRPEARRRSERYLRGLLVQQTDRRNAENLAEAIPGATPRALQRFLTAEQGAWQTLTVAEGAQGPRTHQFVGRRVWESRDGVPGREGWLVLRRNPAGTEPKAYLANAPADAALAQLAEVGARRWASETAFQQAKGEAGLDEYEVRGWVGWQHHVTLVLLAAAFLLTIQPVRGEAAPRRGVPSRPRPPLAWRGRMLLARP